MSQEIKSVAQALDFIKNRYEKDEKLRNSLKDFTDPLEMTFLDNNTKAFVYVKGDQGIIVKASSDDSATIKIHFESEQTMFDIMNKKLGELSAFKSGKVKIIAGGVKNLLKLRKLLF